MIWFKFISSLTPHFAALDYFYSCYRHALTHRTADGHEADDTDQEVINSSPRPYRLWYTIEVQASAPPPERTLEVTCSAHSAVAVDIAVTNPTRERIVMDVFIEGEALIGEPTVVLHPRQQVTYHITFAPTVIGEYTGR